MRTSSLLRALLTTTLVSLGAGCNAAVEVGLLGSPTGETQAGGDGGAGGSGGAEPIAEGPPRVQFTSPDDGAVVEGDTVRITGTSESNLGVATVFVAVGPNVARVASSDDNFKTWWVDASVPKGKFKVEAWAFDVDRVPSKERARLDLEGASGDDSGAPTITVAEPKDGSSPLSPSVLVRGTAFDDLAVVKIETRRNGELLQERPVETDDFYATWTRLITLLPGETNELVFTAYDAAGHKGEASIKLQGVTVTDTQPPMLTVTSPKDAAKVSGEELMLTGSASDNIGVSQVKVRVAKKEGNAPVYGPYVQATTSDGFGSWQATIAAPPGPLSVQVRAIDVSGLATTRELTITNDFVPMWGDERVIPLRDRDGDPVQSPVLELDRNGVNAIINADLQKQIKMLDLDPTALLESSLTQIKSACGEAWKQDSADPKHDCSLTPLGQTFKGADGTWKSSAEYSLVRLLTMTPANVVVDGTSIDGLQNIADGAILGIKIGGGFNQVLAETMGIPRTREIVSTPSAVAALKTQLLQTHPSIGAGGTIPVTLWDAMNDFTTLADVLGPKGGHPGVVDPSYQPKAQLFTQDFKMKLKAKSNLRWRDGVDLDKGKDYIAVVIDKTGPSLDDVLEFDFISPENFDVLGLAPSPAVDLRFRINENPSMIPSCAGSDACKGNLPGSPATADSIWATPGWEVEHIVAEAARLDYKDRVYQNCLIDFAGCQAEVRVGQNGDPPGWIEFDVLFNLGNPPKSQYIWELISEVGQVALHNFGSTKISEGDANVAFTLQGVSVGLTADQIRQAVRPYMQDQAPKLSEGLLGDYAKNNGAVDFFYQVGDDGAPYLYFIAKEDPRPIDAYDYPNPGFFADPALTAAMKVSTTADGGSGDAVHEKVKLSAGERTLYMQDNAGGVYRLRVTVPEGPKPEITVRVSRKLKS